MKRPRKVAELTPAVKLYNEGEFDTAIPILWRIYQADRSHQDARSYLLRCYYNQGIAQLQNGLFPEGGRESSARSSRSIPTTPKPCVTRSSPSAT